MRKQLNINGKNFYNSAEFYDEGSASHEGPGWKIGRNLNAYDDVLRSGFGMREYEEPFTLTWINAEQSRNGFSYPATILYLEAMRTTYHPSNILSVKKKIEKAKAIRKVRRVLAAAVK